MSAAAPPFVETRLKLLLPAPSSHWLRVIIFPPSHLILIIIITPYSSSSSSSYSFSPDPPPPHPSTPSLFLLPFHLILPPFLLNMTDSPGRDQLLPRRLGTQKSVIVPPPTHPKASASLYLGKKSQERARKCCLLHSTLSERVHSNSDQSAS